MRVVVRVLTFSLFILIAPQGRSVDPAGGAPVAIEKLVAQLGDKNFRVRQAAGRALEERGEEALPALRQASSNTDEEICRRAEVLTQKIERLVLLTPKRVTMRMKDRSVEDVIKELGRQTGYRLQFQGGNSHKITIEVENASYWQVLEKICNDGRLTPGFDDQQGLVFLYQQDTISPYTYHNGPFRLVAQNFNYNRYVNLANIPRNVTDPTHDNSLNFGFLIQAEPKVPLLSVGTPKLTKAEDEKGVSLLPHLQEGQQFNVQYNQGNGLYRNFQHSTAAVMANPTKDATQAKIVKGTVTVTILAGARPDVTIEKLAAGKKKYTGSGQTADIEIEEIIEQNKVWTLTMTIKKHVRNGEVQDFNWINCVPQRLELYDAKGRKFNSNGVSNFINNAATNVQASYQFTAPSDTEMGPAVKLVLAEWLTISHDLDFEFKDLPLP